MLRGRPEEYPQAQRKRRNLTAALRITGRHCPSRNSFVPFRRPPSPPFSVASPFWAPCTTLTSRLELREEDVKLRLWVLTTWGSGRKPSRSPTRHILTYIDNIYTHSVISSLKTSWKQGWFQKLPVVVQYLVLKKVENRACFSFPAVMARGHNGLYSLNH